MGVFSRIELETSYAVAIIPVVAAGLGMGAATAAAQAAVMQQIPPRLAGSAGAVGSSAQFAAGTLGVTAASTVVAIFYDPVINRTLNTLPPVPLEGTSTADLVRDSVEGALEVARLLDYYGKTPFGQQYGFAETAAKLRDGAHEGFFLGLGWAGVVLLIVALIGLAVVVRWLPGRNEGPWRLRLAFAKHRNGALQRLSTAALGEKRQLETGRRTRSVRRSIKRADQTARAAEAVRKRRLEILYKGAATSELYPCLETHEIWAQVRWIDQLLADGATMAANSPLAPVQLAVRVQNEQLEHQRRLAMADLKRRRQEATAPAQRARAPGGPSGEEAYLPPGRLWGVVALLSLALVSVAGTVGVVGALILASVALLLPTFVHRRERRLRRACRRLSNSALTRLEEAVLDQQRQLMTGDRTLYGQFLIRAAGRKARVARAVRAGRLQTIRRRGATPARVRHLSLLELDVLFLELDEQVEFASSAEEEGPVVRQMLVVADEVLGRGVLPPVPQYLRALEVAAADAPQPPSIGPGPTVSLGSWMGALGSVPALRVQGSQPTILIVSGWRRNANYWRPLLEGFRAHGQAAVAVDLPGLGAPAGDGPLVDRCLEALDEVIEATDGPVVLYGHAVGASVVAIHAIERRNPRVVGVALDAPFGVAWLPEVTRGLRQARRALRLPPRLTLRRRLRLAAEWGEPGDTYDAQRVMTELSVLTRFADEVAGRFDVAGLQSQPVLWIFRVPDDRVPEDAINQVPDHPQSRKEMHEGPHLPRNTGQVDRLGESLLRFAHELLPEPAPRPRLEIGWVDRPEPGEQAPPPRPAPAPKAPAEAPPVPNTVLSGTRDSAQLLQAVPVDAQERNWASRCLGEFVLVGRALVVAFEGWIQAADACDEAGSPDEDLLDAEREAHAALQEAKRRLSLYAEIFGYPSGDPVPVWIERFVRTLALLERLRTAAEQLGRPDVVEEVDTRLMVLEGCSPARAGAIDEAELQARMEQARTELEGRPLTDPPASWQDTEGRPPMAGDVRRLLGSPPGATPTG